MPDEPGHRRGVAHDTPRVVSEVHPHQHVTRQVHPGDRTARAVADLDDLLGRDDRFKDVVLHVEVLHPSVQVLFHLVLHAGVGVQHVPLAELRGQLTAQLFNGSVNDILIISIISFRRLILVGVLLIVSSLTDAEVTGDVII